MKFAGEGNLPTEGVTLSGAEMHNREWTQLRRVSLMNAEGARVLTKT